MAVEKIRMKTDTPERRASFDSANPDKIYNSMTGEWEPLESAGLPGGGNPGDQLINTSPGHGEWANPLGTEAAARQAADTALQEAIDGKTDKVNGATNNNFAALDANGNLKDSGKNASSFITDEVNLQSEGKETEILLPDGVHTLKELFDNLYAFSRMVFELPPRISEDENNRLIYQDNGWKSHQDQAIPFYAGQYGPTNLFTTDRRFKANLVNRATTTTEVWVQMHFVIKAPAGKTLWDGSESKEWFNINWNVNIPNTLAVDAGDVGMPDYWKEDYIIAVSYGDWTSAAQNPQFFFEAAQSFVRGGLYVAP